MLVTSKVLENLQCSKCAQVDWRVGLAGLEYHLDQYENTERTWQNAEKHCVSLGLGGHLASLGSEDEKFAIGDAFLEHLPGLTKVWIGLSNLDDSGNPVADKADGTPAWRWSDGQSFEGEPADGWWEWDSEHKTVSAKKKCVYVDTKNDYKWGVADCDTKLVAGMCERSEDSCDANAIATCNRPDLPGRCANAKNGTFYCICPDKFEVPDFDPQYCVSCDGNCKFDIATPDDVRAVRFVHVASDKQISQIKVSGSVSVNKCPSISNNVAVYHVDQLTGVYTECYDDTHQELVFNMKKNCGASAASKKLEKSGVVSKPNNPCVGKIGGTLEMIVKTNKLGIDVTLEAPSLSVELASAENVCSSGTPGSNKKKDEPAASGRLGLIVVIATVAVIGLAGVGFILYRKKSRVPTHAYTIQNDDDDEIVQA